MGLLNLDEDARLGLLAAGLGMLGASTNNPWQALGRGGLLGLNAMEGSRASRAGAEQKRLQEEMLRAQIENLYSQMEERKAGAEDARKKAADAATLADRIRKAQMGVTNPDLGPLSTLGKPPSPEEQAMIAARMVGDPKTLSGVIKDTRQEYGQAVPTADGMTQFPKYAGGQPITHNVRQPQDEWERIPTPEGIQPGQQWYRNKRTGEEQPKGQRPPAPAIGSLQVDARQPDPGKWNNAFSTTASAVFKESYENAKRSADTISAVNEARDAISGGTYQGRGATIKEATVNALNNFFGFEVDSQTLANTGRLRSALGQFLLAKAKSLGVNPSNADNFRIDTIVGTIETDPNALNEMLNVLDDFAKRGIVEHNKKWEQIKQSGGAYIPFDMGVEIPAPRGSGVGGDGWSIRLKRGK